KSRVTSLSICTVRNGPNGVGAGSPRISTRKAADSTLLREGMMVWLSLILIAAIPLYEKFVFVIRFLKGNIRKGRARRLKNLVCGNKQKSGRGVFSNERL